MSGASQAFYDKISFVLCLHVPSFCSGSGSHTHAQSKHIVLAIFSSHSNSQIVGATGPLQSLSGQAHRNTVAALVTSIGQLQVVDQHINNLAVLRLDIKLDTRRTTPVVCKIRNLELVDERVDFALFQL